MTPRTKCLALFACGVSAIFVYKTSPLSAFLIILILCTVIYIIAQQFESPD